ncbi:MAG: flagellar type III secretion system pore protein FliP [Candidatus Caenarcaniphilales bacterium]|nr:flagellar type III secretion system pore protein FliP [Candidatus Caenarcaniphilales bacterium]
MNPQYIDSLLPANPEPTLQFLSFLIVLAFIPLIVLTTTPFLRIIIVLSLIRQAIGVPQSPPNLVLTGLALILTTFIMGPSFDEINQKAITPLARKEITVGQAMSVAYIPLRARMLNQVDQKDIRFFYELSERPAPTSAGDIGFSELIAAHILGELRIAFSLGFLVFIPFLVVDLIVANILLALGMMFLSPTIISLPFKLMVFVAVDGWALLIKGLVESFR